MKIREKSGMGDKTSGLKNFQSGQSHKEENPDIGGIKVFLLKIDS